MLAEAELICSQTVAVQYLCVPSPAGAESDGGFYGVPSVPTPKQIKSPVFCSSESALAIGLSHSELAMSCSTTVFDSLGSKFAPKIRSGSHTDIGPRGSNEDEHIRIDDLSSYLDSPYNWSQPISFYAVFDGHGGPDAAAYLKNNAMKIFFEDTELAQASDDIDEKFLQSLESSHHRSFLLADRALADEQSCVDSYCGTTALTALVLGKHLLIANVGDCRAVLCRKGDAVQLSQDHRPSCEVERIRVENLGGKVEYGYLNGELAVTRALGDWYMKLPFGSASPLTAEPEFQQTLLTEDDEFLIIGCDGIWDVMSNQEAVALVRRELRHHNDPQLCARELINQALRRDTCDNVTVIVVCFSSPEIEDPLPSLRPRLRICMSEEARNKLRNLLEGN